MTTTVHRLVTVWNNDHTAVSDEWLDELWAAGARSLVVQLQDTKDKDGNWFPTPRAKVDLWKSKGWKVGGAVRPSGNPLGGALWTPAQTASWTQNESKRLALNGILEFNFEQEVQQADLRGENWSTTFVPLWRSLRPRFSSQLCTYPVEGLNHSPYINANFRLSGQTFSPTNLWEWPVTWYANAKGDGWAQRVGWQRSYVKPCLPVQEIGGKRMDIPTMVANSKLAGTIGCTLYPINQAMPPSIYLTPLIQALLHAGVAY